MNCKVLFSQSNLSLVYITEISSKGLRGTLVNALNITQALGLVLTFSLSLIVIIIILVDI